MNPTVGDIAKTIEEYAPLALQENYDNSGLLIGNPGTPCRGVLITFDVTPQTVEEAIRSGCNLIVSHHPLIFKGLKHLNNSTPVERSVELAVKNNMAVYSAHTSMDNAPGGVSHIMAEMIGLHGIVPLSPEGSGASGNLPAPLTPEQLVAKVKSTFNAQCARCSDPFAIPEISKVAVGGGSGSFLITNAIAAGAQALVTADIKYHDFLDYADRIFLIDIGHFESERHITEQFYRIISKKFPTFALRYATTIHNPVNYL